MSRRRALVVGALSLLTLLVHVLLVRAMAHGHVAHVLLGSGNAAPPLGAATLAVSLVIVRFAAVVIAPGLLLASLASLVAHVLVGPPRGGDQGSGADGADGADGAEDGKVSSSGTGSSIGGTGLNIEGRAT